MNKYKLFAKKSTKNGCFANNGEELVVAPLNTKKIKLKEDEWFFIGVESKKPSRYAWVKQEESDIDIESISDEFIEAKLLSRKDREIYINMAKSNKTSLSKLSDDTPIACCWIEVGLAHKVKRFHIHRVFFDKKPDSDCEDKKIIPKSPPKKPIWKSDSPVLIISVLIILTVLFLALDVIYM